MNHARDFTVERASVDVESGTFRAVVFTDGEASDGHILSIEGGEVPETIPLFVNHDADPRTQLGSLHRENVTAHQVVMRGEVFLGGSGAEAEIRRDILAKMAAGHVSRMSGRWSANDEDTVYRTDLDTNHPAFVGQKKAKRDFRFRSGRFFKRWRALEGSVVGLGADPAATMRWAEEASSPAVSAFYRGLIEPPAEEPESEEPLEIAASPEAESMERESDVAAVETPAEEPEAGRTEPEAVPAVEEPEEAAPRAEEPEPEPEPAESAAASIRSLLESGVSVDEIHAIVDAQREEDPDPIAQVMELVETLQARLAAVESGAVGTVRPMSPKRVAQMLREEMERERAEFRAGVREYIDQQRGKVPKPGDVRAELAAALRQRVEARRRGQGRVQGEPPPPPRPRDVVETFRRELRGVSQDALAEIGELLNAHRDRAAASHRAAAERLTAQGAREE